ncbi:MAG: hypothetical protein R3F46_04280 [bacterium]
MLWHSRRISRFVLLLLGGMILFADWLDEQGPTLSQLPLRSSPYRSADPPRSSDGLYHQQPQYGSELPAGRQAPDYLGLDDSLIHMEPFWQHVEPPPPSDEELLSQPFDLWEYGLIPAEP